MSLTIDYHETLTNILSTLGLDGVWEHSELIGAVVMSGSRVTWIDNGDQKIYHISSRRHIDDAIFSVDYDKGCHVRVIAPPRPILGYVTPTEFIKMTPLFDGTTVRIFWDESHSEWVMSSRRAIRINDMAMNTETFGDTLKRMVPLDKLNKSAVYVVTITAIVNCPRAGTVDEYHILEESIIVDDKIVVTFHDVSGDETLGYVYRTAEGIYIDRSDVYATLAKVMYDVPLHVISSIAAETNTDKSFVRKIYVITRAILRGWDDCFAMYYPSMTVDYVSVSDFIGALVRNIFTMCCTKTRNPMSLGTFVYRVADKIGPLKTKAGKRIVVDTLFSKDYVEPIVIEYLLAAKRR